MNFKLNIIAKLILLSVSMISFTNAACGTASSFVLEEATIDSVHAAMSAQQITCEQLVTAYIDRIRNYNLSVNKAAPINAITEINPYVLSEARALDDAYAKTKSFVGPLHCVPVLIKDNIGAFDSSMSTGSFAMLGTQPIQDAFVVAQLRKAGAIILAHTAMDEFAWGANGMSSRSGRVGNAYDTSQNPGGSSAGTGAGISANFGLVGIGTDNSGSVRIPSAFNGLYGLRSSTGLISQNGIFPMGNLDGVPGPMTRTVKDLALLLDVIAKSDASDAKTQNIPRVKSYADYLNANGLQGKRIGIVHMIGQYDTFKGMPAEIYASVQQAYQKMHEQGATLVDDVRLPQFNNDRKNNMAGMIEDLNAYLASYPATRKNFQDICSSNRTRTFGNIDKCIKFMKSVHSKSSVEYIRVLQLFKKNKEYVEKYMVDNKLDALLIPISKLGAATYDMKFINTFQGALSSNSGMPSMVINIGYLGAHHMPVGIELLAKQYNEPILIEMAYAYEQHASPRLVPQMPELNDALNDYSIADLNHLFTLIGQDAYQKVLRDRPAKENAADALPPEKFRQLVLQRLQTP